MPCTQTEHTQAQKRDALYTEAETVYRRYWVEGERLQAIPNAQISPELEAVTGGQFREWQITLLRKSAGMQRVSGESRLVWVKRLPGLSRDGSIVALNVCFDSTGARYNNPNGGAPTPGIASDQYIFLGRAPGEEQLRIINSDFLEVESC